MRRLIPLEPQPPDGVDVTWCYTPGFYYEAITEGLAFGTIFYRCPVHPNDAELRRLAGRWFWQFDEPALARGGAGRSASERPSARCEVDSLMARLAVPTIAALGRDT